MRLHRRFIIATDLSGAGMGAGGIRWLMVERGPDKLHGACIEMDDARCV